MKKICFLHYGIGWADGVNTVIETLAKEIQRENPRLKLYFIGGEIKRPFLKNAVYQTIPELLPRKIKLNKTIIKKKGVKIAQKLSKLTKGIEVVVIENPFMGGYHLPAMIGYSLYAKKYKPKGSRVFFRIHDFYKDSSRYFKDFQKFFSRTEIKEIINGKGIDGFFVINRALKEKLVKGGIPKEKIFYLPNGIDGKLFNKPLRKQEKNFIYQSLKIPLKFQKNAKFLLYPVRVVPRKNIEEAILLTSLIREITKENYILVVSGKIDKNDPQSRIYFNELKELRKLVNFPIIFAKKPLPSERKYGQKGEIKKFSLGDLYQISEAIVMTSLREGFGYPFLECWFSKKIIIGRRIEEVIRDFEKNGLKLGWLYHQFSIPALIKQIELLQNKKKQKRIIEANLEKAREVYEISKVADRFLELVGLK